MTFRGDHVDELISASLSGDLTDAERAEMDAHLARCEKCRATLASFKMERRILSALPPADAPRDLSARVRAGIESGRFGVPWWRRPGSQVPLLASAAVFAAAVLSVVYFGHLLPAPVGQASGSPTATVSSVPSSSSVASTPPSVGPSTPPAFLAPGQLGYLELSGASLQPSRLSFINDVTGASIDLGTVSGPPLAASLSPDGQWLAYITRKGQTGANEVWAVHLGEGESTHLGCSSAPPFTDRLRWSPDSRYVAYTLVGAGLGATAGCEAPVEGADVWLFDTTTGQRSTFDKRGNVFAADFDPGSGARVTGLWVSGGYETPASAAFGVGTNIDGAGLSNVFLPLFSPDGHRALFWDGTMTSTDGMWQFSRGGLPQLSGDFRSTGPASPWAGTPLFSDLVPYGGEAFAYGKFAWGPDSDLVAFWGGAWTGVPQSADGTYPSQQAVYVGRISAGLLSSSSRLQITVDPNAPIVDVTFTTDGTAAVVTSALTSAGIGDPPSASLQIVPLDGSTTRTIGGGVNPPPWDGPAVFGH